VLAALWAAPCGSLAAQAATVSGRVVLGGRDGRPVAGRFVVLHQITMGDGGPLDSIRTDADGRWRLRVPHVDTTAIYVVSAQHDGLAYFSQPLRVAPGQAATADPLVLWDTSSSGPPILLRRRLVTVARPSPDGSREVLEILELENVGRETRVPPDTLRAAWTGAIPAEALSFTVQQGDFSADAVAQRGGTVLLFGPIQPEGRHQLSYRYVLGGAVQSLSLPIDQPTDELDLLFEDTTTAVTAPNLHALGVGPIEQRRFTQFRADSLPAGAAVRIAFPAGRLKIDALLPVIVGLVVVAMGAGLWIALRRSQASAVSSQQ